MSHSESSNQAREKIFQAIKSSPKTKSTTREAIIADAANLLSDIEDARPSLLDSNPVEAFYKKLSQGMVIGTSCEKIESLEQLPEAASRFLASHGQDNVAQVIEKPLIQDLDWSTWQTSTDLTHDNQSAISFADFAIAETGSVVIRSGAETPVLLHFLPLYLVIAVAESKILPFMDDYAKTIDPSLPPRNTCVITGASGTTDIEGVLVQGAHGPEFLHIIIVQNL